MKKNLLITCVMLLFAVVSMAQNKITVSGVVSDKTGMTVIGATVSVKGAPQQGVVTGLDGDYKITNVPSNAVLLYSYIGMKDQEIAVNGRTTINVVMQEDNMLIDEVVVVGYGVQRKSDLTGAVGSIKSDDLKKISTPNVANAFKVVCPVYLSLQAVLRVALLKCAFVVSVLLIIAIRSMWLMECLWTIYHS
jgi:hypothetical protein